MNEAAGRNVDVEFDIMLEGKKANVPSPKPHVLAQNMKISICVRKRPIF